MSRVRVLETENEELARQQESGRPARANALLTLRKRLYKAATASNKRMSSIPVRISLLSLST